MTLKERIEQDLKTALLAGDKDTAETLRGLKSTILYEEVAKGARDRGLDDSEIISLLSKEAKKRQESADLYVQGGSEERAKKELTEKKLIETYLPEQASAAEIEAAVSEAIQSTGASSAADLGKIIGAVRAKLGPTADGAIIAKIAKEKLQ